MTKKVKEILKLYADWCGPCKVFAPVVEQAAKELDVNITSVNVDENSMITAKYGIRGIPAMVKVYEDGTFTTLVGLAKKQDVINWINAE